MYNKNEILERLNFFRNRAKELGGFTKEIVCKEVAKEEDILKLEEELGYTLPIEFRQALKEISSHLEFFGIFILKAKKYYHYRVSWWKFLRVICILE